MHSRMLSAICFNLDRSKILLSGNGLNPYHRIMTFSDLEKENFENTVGNGEKCWLPALNATGNFFFSCICLNVMQILSISNYCKILLNATGFFFFELHMFRL